MEVVLKFILIEYEWDLVNWIGYDIIYKIKYFNLVVLFIIKKICWFRILYFCNLRCCVFGFGLF